MRLDPSRAAAWLAARRRVALEVRESPVEAWQWNGARVWVKREDLNAPFPGGNKRRALQFLLSGATPDRPVLTVGGIGSMHVLATLVSARAIGVGAGAHRWPHAMHPVAQAIDAAIIDTGCPAPVHRTPVNGWLAATTERLRRARHWVPFGGASPMGALGQVEAAFEFARQVRDGLAPEPEAVYLPLGSGGTAAGLALGFAIAGLRTRVHAVRCGPGGAHERPWLSHLAGAAGALVGAEPSQVAEARDRIVVDHSLWTGAYGRGHPDAAVMAADLWRTQGVVLDATYTARACYAALRAAAAQAAPVLYWHTLDARGLTLQPSAP